MRESEDAVRAQLHSNTKSMYEAVLGQAYANARFPQAPEDARFIQDPPRPADCAGVSADHHTMTDVMRGEPTPDELVEMMAEEVAIEKETKRAEEEYHIQ